MKDLTFSHKLPVKAIGRFEFYLHMCEIEYIEEIYLETNWFLGKVDDFRRSTYFFLEGVFDQINVGLIKWTNVTELELTFIEAVTLMELLVRLPSLRSVILVCVCYTTNYGSLQQRTSQLKEVDINRLNREGCTLSNTTYFIPSLMHQHPNISKLKLPEDLKDQVGLGFQDTQWRHVELEEPSIEEMCCEDCKITVFGQADNPSGDEDEG